MVELKLCLSQLDGSIEYRRLEIPVLTRSTDVLAILRSKLLQFSPEDQQVDLQIQYEGSFQPPRRWGGQRINEFRSLPWSCFGHRRRRNQSRCSWTRLSSRTVSGLRSIPSRESNSMEFSFVETCRSDLWWMSTVADHWNSIQMSSMFQLWSLWTMCRSTIDSFRTCLSKDSNSSSSKPIDERQRNIFSSVFSFVFLDRCGQRSLLEYSSAIDGQRTERHRRWEVLQLAGSRRRGRRWWWFCSSRCFVCSPVTSPDDLFILCIESLMFVLAERRKWKVNSLQVDLEEWVDVDVLSVLHMQSKDQNSRRSNTNIVDQSTESFHIDCTTRIAIRIDLQADERVSRLQTNVAKLWDHVDRYSLGHDASKTHHRSKEQTTTEFLNQRNYSTHI